MGEAPATGRRRRRLTVDARRDELLRLGLELFSTRAYEEISIEEIAEQAEISRGLLYHYFPTKRDFYVEVTRLAVAQAAEATVQDASLPADQQLQAAIDAFLRYAEEHSHGFLTAYRGSLAGDPEVRAIVEQARRGRAETILSLVAGDQQPTPLLTLAVHGWLVMAQAVTAQWLTQSHPARKAVRDLLFASLNTAIGAAAEPQDDGPQSKT